MCRKRDVIARDNPLPVPRYDHSFKQGVRMASQQPAKLVLITGATDGLGKAAALYLAERGYRVFAAGRSPQKRAQLDALARERKLPLETLELDVCNEASAQQAVRHVLDQAGAIDILINNAGVAHVGTVEDLALADWQRQFDTNVFGVVRVTQAALPHMRERRSGRILMMSSVAGLMTAPAQGAYSASKHALEAISNALRYELYSFNIDVVLIEPGYIVTGIHEAATNLSKPYAEKFKSGLYAPLYARCFSKGDETRSASKTTPEDCARIMLEAIESPRPRARYGVTPLAATVKWGNRLLSDAVKDALLRRRFGIVREP
jgi:NAD(P)-dependent dehydrogenase (short-subunit alcohol dehydrogenase family)